MITYICSIINNDQVQEYIGIVLMILEALLVFIKFLQYIVDPESKFGKFLSKLLKGLKFVKDETQHVSESIKKENNENGQTTTENPADAESTESRGDENSGA